jgi:diguanylate cyclase (GGDEF)-like protein
MLDVDHFKKINDMHGHLAGDSVLIEVAGVIARSIRSVDYAARYGGEEFLIILFETPASTAVAAAERVRLGVAEQRIEIDGRYVSATVSIGISEVRVSDTNPTSVINRADNALYQAKEEGRNRVVCA